MEKVKRPYFMAGCSFYDKVCDMFYEGYSVHRGGGLGDHGRGDVDDVAALLLFERWDEVHSLFELKQLSQLDYRQRPIT